MYRQRHHSRQLGSATLAWGQLIAYCRYDAFLPALLLSRSHYAPLGAALHFAAAVLLAREAGAIVSDQTGADWALDSPICVVAATPQLHTELLELAREVYARAIA